MVKVDLIRWPHTERHPTNGHMGWSHKAQANEVLTVQQATSCHFHDWESLERNQHKWAVSTCSHPPQFPGICPPASSPQAPWAPLRVLFLPLSLRDTRYP